MKDVMSAFKQLPLNLAPPQRQPNNTGRCTSETRTRWLLVCTLGILYLFYSRTPLALRQTPGPPLPPFFVNITNPGGLCIAPQGPSISHAGYIGLNGDSAETPKRSFFWYFEAENDAEKAPIILTVGGGPGTSGLTNPLWAQGPCKMAENGTIPNPNRWTEHFNLIALDHPVGTGLSYGTKVNNSRDAAIDVYDFLQKFFQVFPELAQNQFILSGGSYGGMYIPHIATVIHEQNIALAQGAGQAGAVHINLESMMVSNPFSDPASHYTWLLNFRCHHTTLYNSTTCAEMFGLLPACLDSIRLAQEAPDWDVERHATAWELCDKLQDGDTHNILQEDIRQQCYEEDTLECLPPSLWWIESFFRRADVKDALGVPGHVQFFALNDEVEAEFRKYGDKIKSSYPLYEPLLAAGIRLLHYIGAQDANCDWMGILSFLKLIKSPFQDAFLRTPDVPWPTPRDNTTVRVVGPDAGNMTYILVDQAGHFVAHDQPKLVKSIVEHWVLNTPFVTL